jgi:hypothetical protein
MKWDNVRTGREADDEGVVTDQTAGTAGMTLAERPEPQAAINDVVVQVHASGFVPKRVMRDWRLARAWLARELSRESMHP